MKLLADQCVFGKTVRLLREAGHEVATLKELGKQTAEDEEVLKIAASLDALLITNDLHFSNILIHPPSGHEGVVVLRVSLRTQGNVHKILLDLFGERDREALRNATVVVDGKTYRIRKGDK